MNRITYSFKIFKIPKRRGPKGCSSVIQGDNAHANELHALENVKVIG
jgi:hypothetical protein